MSPILRAISLNKTCRLDGRKIQAVRDVSLEVVSGDFFAITGTQGSPGSVLLNLIGCLEKPDSGRLFVEEHLVFDGLSAVSETSLTRVRREFFGHISSIFNLLPTLSVRENVLLPQVFHRNAGYGVDELLSLLGLEHCAKRRPGALSDSEKLRAALARALINRPGILLADDPAGNLDRSHNEDVGALLKRLNREFGITIILATDDPALANVAKKRIGLQDGRVAISAGFA
jgi:ABC-type lipoprotein export system ATPase subunit